MSFLIFWVFLRICPLDIRYLIYWPKVTHSILFNTFNLCIVGSGVTSFISDANRFYLFSFFS